MCPAICDPMDCSPPGFFIHGILQARILEWVTIPFSRGSSQPTNQTQVSYICRQILYHLSLCGSQKIVGNFYRDENIRLLISWETYMQVKKQHRTRYGTTDWFKIGKGVLQSCILSLCLFNFYAEYIMRNARLDESHCHEKYQQPQIHRWYHSNGRKQRGTKVPLDERREWKSGLKLNILASGPITSWQTDGKKVETVTDFIFLGSKITADGDCSHEILRHYSLKEKLWQT